MHIIPNKTKKLRIGTVVTQRQLYKYKMFDQNPFRDWKSFSSRLGCLAKVFNQLYHFLLCYARITIISCGFLIGFSIVYSTIPQDCVYKFVNSSKHSKLSLSNKNKLYFFLGVRWHSLKKKKRRYLHCSLGDLTQEFPTPSKLPYFVKLSFAERVNSLIIW